MRVGTLATCIGILFLLCGLVSGQPPVTSSDTDTAWKQLQQAAVLLGHQQTDEQVVTAALLRESLGIQAQRYFRLAQIGIGLILERVWSRVGATHEPVTV